MPRWAMFLPFALIVALTALIGWRQGWLVANVTETEVIEATAARYVELRRAVGPGRAPNGRIAARGQIRRGHRGSW